jgi:hypothetical protein
LDEAGEFSLNAAYFVDCTKVSPSVLRSYIFKPRVLSFVIDGVEGTVENNVNGTSTIELTLPYGTVLNSLNPTIDYRAHSISPVLGTHQDYSSSIESPVIFILEANDGTESIYLVTVREAASSDKNIVSFSIDGQVGESIIDEEEFTIHVTMPYGSDLSALAPAITIDGASVDPASDVVQNFTSSPLIYTVTAADLSSREYSVTVVSESEIPICLETENLLNIALSGGQCEDASSYLDQYIENECASGMALLSKLDSYKYSACAKLSCLQKVAYVEYYIGANICLEAGANMSVLTADSSCYDTCQAALPEYNASICSYIPVDPLNCTAPEAEDDFCQDGTLVYDPGEHYIQISPNGEWGWQYTYDLSLYVEEGNTLSVSMAGTSLNNDFPTDNPSNGGLQIMPNDASWSPFADWADSIIVNGPIVVGSPFEGEIDLIMSHTGTISYLQLFIPTSAVVDPLEVFNLNLTRFKVCLKPTEPVVADPVAEFASLGIVGSATALICEDCWNTDIFMSSSGYHQWTLVTELYAGELKFRADGSWLTNWGSSSFPSGTANQDGPNIPIPSAGLYRITFDSSTGAYNFEEALPD